jgi:outer membrane receptor for Fe3+-dicitrate
MRIQFWSFAFLNIIFLTNQGLAQSAIKVSDTTNGTSIAPVEMESITILAPRKDIGQIAHLSGSEVLLREQEIKRFDQVDGNQLLQTLPGVYTQQEDGWGLALQSCYTYGRWGFNLTGALLISFGVLHARNVEVSKY